MPLNDANTTLKRINTQEQADHGTRQQRFTGATVPTPNREQIQMRRPLGNISQGQAQETPRPPTSREELGQSLRVPVPNATASLRTGASSIPMKHQTSQSTNSSDDREPRKTIFQRPMHPQTERQPQTMAQVQKHVQTNVQKQNVRSVLVSRTGHANSIKDTDAPNDATTLSFGEHGYSSDEDRNDEQTMFRRVPDDGTCATTHRGCSGNVSRTFGNVRLIITRYACVQRERPQLSTSRGCSVWRQGRYWVRRDAEQCRG